MVNAKRFVCTKCPKKFPRKRQLDIHLISHKESRTYPCSYCIWEFFNQRALDVHSQIKHPNKPMKPIENRITTDKLIRAFDIQRNRTATDKSIFKPFDWSNLVGKAKDKSQHAHFSINENPTTDKVINAFNKEILCQAFLKKALINWSNLVSKLEPQGQQNSKITKSRFLESQVEKPVNISSVTDKSTIKSFNWSNLVMKDSAENLQMPISRACDGKELKQMLLNRDCIDRNIVGDCSVKLNLDQTESFMKNSVTERNVVETDVHVDRSIFKPIDWAGLAIKLKPELEKASQRSMKATEISSEASLNADPIIRKKELQTLAGEKTDCPVPLDQLNLTTNLIPSALKHQQMDILHNKAGNRSDKKTFEQKSDEKTGQSIFKSINWAKLVAKLEKESFRIPKTSAIVQGSRGSQYLVSQLDKSILKPFDWSALAEKLKQKSDKRTDRSIFKSINWGSLAAKLNQEKTGISKLDAVSLCSGVNLFDRSRFKLLDKSNLKAEHQSNCIQNSSDIIASQSSMEHIVGLLKEETDRNVYKQIGCSDLPDKLKMVSPFREIVPISIENQVSESQTDRSIFKPFDWANLVKKWSMETAKISSLEIKNQNAQSSKDDEAPVCEPINNLMQTLHGSASKSLIDSSRMKTRSRNNLRPKIVEYGTGKAEKMETSNVNEVEENGTKPVNVVEVDTKANRATKGRIKDNGRNVCKTKILHVEETKVCRVEKGEFKIMDEKAKVQVMESTILTVRRSKRRLVHEEGTTFQSKESFARPRRGRLETNFQRNKKRKLEVHSSQYVNINEKSCKRWRRTLRSNL